MPRGVALPNPNGRKCLYCERGLVGKQKKFCCHEHAMNYRYRQTDQAHRVVAQEVAKNAATELAVQESIKEQVDEVVREKLTADVLNAIGDAVKLLPQAIQTLSNIMASEETDADQKRQAATTLLRYTMGNNSVAPPSVEEDKAPLQVNFNIPGGDLPQRPQVTEAVTSDAEEDREQHECVECHIWKNWPEEFAGQSDRCLACDAALRQRLEDKYGKIELG